jgi:hypothetical protein
MPNIPDGHMVEERILVEVVTGDKHERFGLGPFMHLGCNGFVHYGGLQFAELPRPGVVSINQVCIDGNLLAGGSTVPIDDLDEICRQWLEARGHQVLAPGQEVHVLVEEYDSMPQNAKVFLDEAQAEAEYDSIRADLLQGEPLTDDNWAALAGACDGGYVYLFNEVPVGWRSADA